MLRQNKIISIILSISIVFSLFNCIAYANDEVKEYTLEQLLEMDNQEFLQLEGAQDFYDDICNDVANTEYGGISGGVYAWLEKEDMNVKYTVNKTEMKLENLLGKNIEYCINSPISIDVDYLMETGQFCYQNIFSVDFPECEKRSDSNTITDEEIIQFAKCCYCVNQAIPVDYYRTLLPLAGDCDENILKGDLNFDRMVSISDVAHYTKLNAGLYDITETQIYVGDLDNNGKANAADILALIENLLGNYELI